jgi:hypothetical protein
MMKRKNEEESESLIELRRGERCNELGFCDYHRQSESNVLPYKVLTGQSLHQSSFLSHTRDTHPLES